MAFSKAPRVLAAWLMLGSLLICPNCSAADSAANDWSALKDSLAENKKSMCTFLIFQALDHLSKATQYTQMMRPYIDAGVITEYDDNGRRFVLEISETRRSLLAEYSKTQTGEQRTQILEKYFYKACESKLGTVVAENTMYKSLLKVERLMKRKLRMPDYYRGGDAVEQQQQQS